MSASLTRLKPHIDSAHPPARVRPVLQLGHVPQYPVRAFWRPLHGHCADSGNTPTWSPTASKDRRRRNPNASPAGHGNGQPQEASNASMLLYESGEFSTGTFGEFYTGTDTCILSFSRSSSLRLAKPALFHRT